MNDPVDEPASVALAMVQAQRGNGAAVTQQALRDARVFIAAADALIACRKAAARAELQQACAFGPMPSALARTRWPSNVTSEPAHDRGNEDGA